MSLWPDPIPAVLRPKAVEAFEAGNVTGFLCKASNEYGLDLVWRNNLALQSRGIYEKALVDAFIGTRTNNLHWPVSQLTFLFRIANRARLRAAGDPIPGTGPYTRSIEVWQMSEVLGASRACRGLPRKSARVGSRHASPECFPMLPCSA